MNNLSIRLNTPQKPLKPAFSDQSKLKKIFFVTKSVTKKRAVTSSSFLPVHNSRKTNIRCKYSTKKEPGIPARPASIAMRVKEGTPFIII